MLDALHVNLNGSPAAPEYFSRRRRVMHRPWRTRSARSGWRTTRCARATCPRDGPRRRLLTTPWTRGRWAVPALVADDARPRARASRPAAGQAVRRVLRLHVLRHDAPVRGGGADPQRVRAARAGLGSPDLRRRQPLARPGVHRRRPGPRAPRAEGHGPGGGPAGPASPQAHPEGPDPARAGRPAARAPRPVRHRPRTAGCSAARTATPSSSPPGGRSGRRSGKPR